MEELNINPPGVLAGLIALVDLRAFGVAGVAGTSSYAEIRRFRWVLPEISSRKLAIAVTGSGRAFTADSTPFPWAIDGGTLDILCPRVCSRARPLGSFAAVGYRWSVHTGCNLRKWFAEVGCSPRSFVRDRQPTRSSPTIHLSGRQRRRQQRRPDNGTPDV